MPRARKRIACDDARAAIRSQYHAALAMLRRAILKCRDDAWNGPEPNRFWHIAYHVLFYTHLYLQKSEADFVPWKKHREEAQFLGAIPGPLYRPAKRCEPYTQREILAYWKLCQKEVDARVAELDLEAPSGFAWLPFNKLELQFYNIRHVQHHAGQLIDRLRNRACIGVGWVGRQP